MTQVAATTAGAVTQMTISPSAADPLAGEVKQLPTPEPKPAAPAEGAPVAPDKAAAVRDPLSKGFAIMAKKDRELRQRNAQIRQEQARQAQVNAQLQAREAQLARFEQLKRQNPLEAVKALGLSYEDLTNYALQGADKPTTELQIQEIKEGMARYIQAQEQKDHQVAQQQAQAAQHAYQETVGEYKEAVANFTASKPDQYELVNMHGEDAQDLIFATQEAHWNKHRKILSMEEASNLVEEYFTDEAKKLTAAKKFQTPAQAAAAVQASGQSPMERAVNTLSGPRPTLTNAMSGSTAPSLLPAKTENDRLARAMAALERK